VPKCAPKCKILCISHWITRKGCLSLASKTEIKSRFFRARLSCAAKRRHKKLTNHSITDRESARERARGKENNSLRKRKGRAGGRRSGLDNQLAFEGRRENSSSLNPAETRGRATLRAIARDCTRAHGRFIRLGRIYRFDGRSSTAVKISAWRIESASKRAYGDCRMGFLAKIPRAFPVDERISLRAARLARKPRVQGCILREIWNEY